jgi:tRNA 2-selenouridine synthase
MTEETAAPASPAPGAIDDTRRAPLKPGNPKAGIVRLPLSFGDLRGFDAIIDTRSPAEYALDHIPGAISCPVLNDDERIRVGTLYKQDSAFAAKRVGAALVARNIGIHIENEFQDRPKNWRPLVYCWRGGTRSGAMTHILRQVGWDAAQLEGGYKAWRAHLVLDLDRLAATFNYIAVTGRTGSGKSRLIEALHAAGGQVLDLEDLAAHKGSVLGSLPDRPQPSQKWFESMIWDTLSRFNPARPVFVEAESRKVGMLRVPASLMARMWQGECVVVDTPDALRIPLLMDEYAHLIENTPLLRFKLDCLRPLHSHERVDNWQTSIEQKNWPALISALLHDHYDPAYSRSMFQNYVNLGRARTVSISDVSDAGFLAVARSLLST